MVKKGRRLIYNELIKEQSNINNYQVVIIDSEGGEYLADRVVVDELANRFIITINDDVDGTVPCHKPVNHNSLNLED